MIFDDRADAGRQLAKQLMVYKNDPDAIVIGLPRGGVVTAFEVAKKLQLPLDIVVPRKIGAPGQEELAVGALTQDGTVQLNKELMKQLHITRADLEETIAKEKKEAQRRLATYRGNRSPLSIQNKTALLIDDGIATGSTMQAAIASARAHGAQKIVVAIPVGPKDTIEKMSKEVDELVCLYQPESFFGVGQFYRYFSQTKDEEVIALMKASERF